MHTTSIRAALAFGLLAGLAACASSTRVSPTPAAVGRAPTPVDLIQVTEASISGRPYKRLGDILVRIDKVRSFNLSPTRADADEKLRVEAAKLGADAVI